MILVLLIMGCAMIGTVFLIGVCAPLSAINMLTIPRRDDISSTVIEETFRDDGHFNDNRGGSTYSESTGEDTVRDNLRELIARKSITTLHSRGMTDEEIKSELLRDFDLTEEQVDKILAEK